MFKGEISEDRILHLLRPDSGCFDAKAIEEDLVKEFGKVGQLEVQRFPLDYGTGRVYSFLRVASPDIQPTDKVVAAGAEVHANELSGLFFWRQSGAEIFDYAHKRGVKLIVYPLRNPSGLEKVNGYPDRQAGHRYNIVDDSGSQGVGNNDFLRYRLPDGTLVDELVPVRSFDAWLWSADVPGLRLPQETRLMQELLRKDLSLGKISAVVDMHQDLISEGVGPGAYFYVMEKDDGLYAPIVGKIEKSGVPILRNSTFKAGYLSGVGLTTDDLGMIVRWDGSWPDLMAKSGTKYAVTTETTGATPLRSAVLVNRIFMEALIEAVAAS